MAERRGVSAQEGALALAAELSPWPPAAVGLVTIGSLGLLGVIHLEVEPDLQAFDLDAEGNVPAAWSALLLVFASVLSLADGVVRAAQAHARWLVVGGVFFFMAVDEAGALHERLEDRLRIDWQVLYLPVFALAAVAGLLLLARLRRIPGSAALFAAGALLWMVAQLLENLQWKDADDKAAHYTPMMVSEELLEMTGSLLFLLAALVALRAVARAR
jgi:hypothetical protein